MAWSRKVEELEAKLATDLAKAKSGAEMLVASFRIDVEAANIHAQEITVAEEVKLLCARDHTKQQSLRETLEEMYARGFDLLADIKSMKALKEEVAALLSDDKAIASGSKSGGYED